MKRDDLKDKYPHILECGDTYVVLLVDGYEETFTFEDICDGMGGSPMSGYRDFGPVSGDHRMINIIYETVKKYFLNEYPQYFNDSEECDDDDDEEDLEENVDTAVYDYTDQILIDEDAQEQMDIVRAED